MLSDSKQPPQPQQTSPMPGGTRSSIIRIDTELPAYSKKQMFKQGEHVLTHKPEGQVSPCRLRDQQQSSMIECIMGCIIWYLPTLTSLALQQRMIESRSEKASRKSLHKPSISTGYINPPKLIAWYCKLM